MIRAYTQARLLIALGFLCAATMVGLAAFAPTRSLAERALGFSNVPSATLALNSCTLGQKAADDSDHIYFLSCGGLY